MVRTGRLVFWHALYFGPGQSFRWQAKIYNVIEENVDNNELSLNTFEPSPHIFEPSLETYEKNSNNLEPSSDNLESSSYNFEPRTDILEPSSNPRLGRKIVNTRNLKMESMNTNFGVDFCFYCGILGTCLFRNDTFLNF